MILVFGTVIIRIFVNIMDKFNNKKKTLEMKLNMTPNLGDEKALLPKKIRK